jgi:hypothetical protein
MGVDHERVHLGLAELLGRAEAGGEAVAWTNYRVAVRIHLVEEHQIDHAVRDPLGLHAALHSCQAGVHE